MSKEQQGYFVFMVPKHLIGFSSPRYCSYSSVYKLEVKYTTMSILDCIEDSNLQLAAVDCPDLINIVIVILQAQKNLLYC